MSQIAAERSEATATCYRRILTELSVFKPSRPLAESTAKDLSAYFSRMCPRVSRSTFARALSVARSFYRHLVRRGVRADDPTEFLRTADFIPRASTPLTGEERSLLQGFTAPGVRGKRDEAMIRFLCDSGVRVSELVALDRVDLVPEEGVVLCGKGARRRRVRVSEATMESLVACRTLASLRAPGDPALFLSAAGKRITRQGFWKILKDHAARLGVPDCSPQSLRSSLAKEMLSRGRSRRDVHTRLGNCSAALLREYENQIKGS